MSTETKQEKNATTVALKALLKKYSRFYFHGTRVYDAPSYSDPYTFAVTAAYDSYDKRNGAESARLDIPGDVHGGHTDKLEHCTYEGQDRVRSCEAYRPLKGFWSLFAGEELLRSAVASLPDDAEIELEVYLDAGSNEILLLANLHADKLYLNAKWTRGTKKHTRKFLIDTSTGRHNTARFGDCRY